MTHRPSPAALYSIVNVDLLPERAQDGIVLLIAFLAALTADPLLTSARLLEQAGSANHYMLDYSLRSESDYSTFRAQDYVVRFRSDLYPMLGSPWDERIAHEVHVPSHAGG